MEEKQQEQLIIAEEVRVDDLSGVFKGSVSIGESETGVVILDGQVEETVPPGTSKLGKWKGRTVFRIRSDEFTLPMNFYGLRAGDEQPVDSHLLAVARLKSADVFYRSIIRDHKGVDSSELGGLVSMGLEKLMASEAGMYEAENLCSDPVPSQNIISNLQNVLEYTLGERGMTLQNIVSVSFSPSEADDILFAQVEQLRSDLDISGKQARDTAKQMATRLWKKGLISIEEAEEMRSAVSSQSDSPGKPLVSLVDTAIDRLETRLTEQAQQLTEQIATLESRGKSPQVTGLAQWADQGGLETDELVRRHIGKVLADSISDIKEVKLDAHKKGFSEVADDLARLENDVDLLQTEVEGAAFGKRSLPKKGKNKKQMIASLVVFEDGVLKASKQFPDSIEKIRAALDGDGDLKKNVKFARDMFRSLKKQFARRGEILSGFEG